MNRPISTAIAALAFLALAAPAAAEDLSFTVINDSSLDVHYFYTSPSSETSWGPDLLGDDKLYAYTEGTATIADGSRECVYDFKYVMSDGETYFEEQIDLCSLGTYTIHE